MSCGFMILPKESLNSSKPMMSMIAATASVATYSILACPYGCSSSALCAAILKPAIVMIDEPASDRLLNASAVIEIAPLNIPAKSLPAKSMRFKIYRLYRTACHIYFVFQCLFLSLAFTLPLFLFYILIYSLFHRSESVERVISEYRFCKYIILRHICVLPDSCV